MFVTRGFASGLWPSQILVRAPGWFWFVLREFLSPEFPWGTGPEVFVSGGVVLVAENEFMLEVVAFMESLGIHELEGSGLKFPAVDWDRLDCCQACAWLAFQGHELPGHLEARLLLGDPNPIVRLLLEWRRHKSSASGMGWLWELAG